MKCSKCGSNIYQGTTCPLCGHVNSFTASSFETPNTQGSAPHIPNSNNTTPINMFTYPMKWYKFLKVSLWIGIVANLISAFAVFNGMQYLDFKDEVYELLPTIKYLDIFSGIFCLIFVVLGFMTWHGLHNYKARGPKTLVWLYILNSAFTLIYTLALAYVIGTAEVTTIYGDSYMSGGYIYQSYLDMNALVFQPSTITSIVTGIVLAIANHIYFKKRAFMFVN